MVELPAWAAAYKLMLLVQPSLRSVFSHFCKTHFLPNRILHYLYIGNVTVQSQINFMSFNVEYIQIQRNNRKQKKNNLSSLNMYTCTYTCTTIVVTYKPA